MQTEENDFLKDKRTVSDEVEISPAAEPARIDEGETPARNGEGENPLRADEGEHRAMFYENSEKRNMIAAQLIEEERMRSVRSILATAIVGLILSVVCGIGVVFSLAALVRASFCKKKFRSQTLDWARNLAILGIVLSGVFIVALVIYFTSQTTVPAEYI